MDFIRVVAQKYTIVSQNEEEDIKPYSKRGKLNVETGWTLRAIEYLEGFMGEPQYGTCAHCGKTIRYACHLSPEDVTVGPDCALALLKNKEDQENVLEFVGNYQKKKKFIKAILEFLTKESQDDSEAEAFVDFLNVAPRLPAFLKASYKTLALGPTLAKTLANYVGPKHSSQKLKTYATRAIFRALLARKKDELIQCLEDAFFEGKKTGRDKGYFFHAKSKATISEFLLDYEDKILHGIGEESLITQGKTFLVAPQA